MAMGIGLRRRFWLQMVLSALRFPADTLAIPPRFLFEVSFDGFTKVFRRSVFGLYLMNSPFVTACSVVMHTNSAIWHGRLPVSGDQPWLVGLRRVESGARYWEASP